MSSFLQNVSQAVRKLKLTLAVFSTVAAAVSFYFFSEQPNLVRTAVLLTSLMTASLLFFTSNQSQKLLTFIKEAIRETRKVVWPTRKEATQITVVVFIFVFLLAIFLWGIDKFLEILLYYLILGWK
jgi:preprotein translocase subunit SecE